MTSWLFALLDAHAQFIKGLLSKNTPVTPQHSCELSVSSSPLPFWFVKADAASGMWGIYEVNGGSSKRFNILPALNGEVRVDAFLLQGDMLS